MKNSGAPRPPVMGGDRDGFECQDLESRWGLNACLLAGGTILQHMSRRENRGSPPSPSGSQGLTTCRTPACFVALEKRTVAQEQPPGSTCRILVFPFEVEENTWG